MTPNAIAISGYNYFIVNGIRKKLLLARGFNKQHAVNEENRENIHEEDLVPGHGMWASILRLKHLIMSWKKCKKYSPCCLVLWYLEVFL
jgi:hypothetical protein